MLYLMLLFIGIAAIAVYLLVVFREVPGAMAERWGELEGLPADLGEWTTDEDSEAAIEALEKIETVDRTATFLAAVGLARQASAAAPQLAKRVVLLTDQQQANWLGLSDTQLADHPPMQVVDVSSPQTRRTGPSSDSKTSDCTVATTSAAKPDVCGPSWITTHRPVFATLSAIASMSRGTSERRSSTLALIPRLSSAEAACSARETDAPQAMKVMSRPSRRRMALPRGTV